MAAFVGIDIGKERLDAYRMKRQQHRSFDHDSAGVKRLLTWLAPGSFVVMEASGGYERRLHQDLTERGVEAAIVNPARVRHFAPVSSADIPPGDRA